MVVTEGVFREIKGLVEKEDFRALQEKVEEMHPYDLSELIQKFEAPLRDRILSHLSDELLIELVPELPEEVQLEFVEVLSPRLAARLLAAIPPDEMADVLGDLTLKSRRNIVSYFSKEKSTEARRLLRYPEDTAGGLMTTEVVVLSRETTASRAIRHIREKAKEYEAVYYIYIVDRNKLVGVLSLRELVLASPREKLEKIMDPDIIKVPVDMDQEEVAYIIADYDLLAVPVVDKDNKLLGIVTVDDVIDVIEEEVTEDMGHLAGTGVGIDKLIEAPVLSVVRARLPWLIFALIGGLIAGSIIGVFTDILSSVVLLAIFIPVIMSMGGNVGIQSSTVFVRGLATGEIEEPWGYFFREIKVGLLMGLLVGLGVGVVANFWKGLPVLGLVVGAAMFATVVLATAIGIAVPKIFDKLGMDPAISASPFVTTIEDIMGLLIYFSIATYMLVTTT
ncbi:MAG: magnesium transporter [Candidatus Hydrothermarchaeota archaeon]|nr:magnesium transporter [Candidatus Hydrothermarchaeota archaeon]